VETVNLNWLALLLVAPLKLGAAEKVPSGAVSVTALVTAAAPPGGMGAPLSSASTVTVTETPPGRFVEPVTLATPETKLNDAVKLPAVPP